MATTTSDKRIVRIAVTRAELAALLGAKAKEAGLIDFDPETTEVYDNGVNGFEIYFDVTYVAPV